MSNQTKQEILHTSILAREQEVMHYQINIDNYTLALQHIAKLSTEEQTELSSFVEQLRGLLASETFEQKKAKVMLSVLKLQVS